jgi:methyl-accepting chemotaxis protein
MRRLKGWREVLSSIRGDAGGDVHDLVEAEAHLWQAHQDATGAASGALESATALAAAVSRSASAVDELADSARGAQGRADEVSPALARVTEPLERLRLVALNLGLDGSRMGDAAGRALAGASDEIRTYVEQGFEAAGDLRAVLEELRPSMGALAARTEQLRKAGQDVAQHASRAQEQAQQCARSLEELGQWARKLSDTDPETAAILARASDHVRALLGELAKLKNATQRELARGVLLPLIQPLLRVLDELGGGAQD